MSHLLLSYNEVSDIKRRVIIQRGKRYWLGKKAKREYDIGMQKIMNSIEEKQQERENNEKEEIGRDQDDNEEEDEIEIENQIPNQNNIQPEPLNDIQDNNTINANKSDTKLTNHSHVSFSSLHELSQFKRQNSIFIRGSSQFPLPNSYSNKPSYKYSPVTEDGINIQVNERRGGEMDTERVNGRRIGKREDFDEDDEYDEEDGIGIMQNTEDIIIHKLQKLRLKWIKYEKKKRIIDIQINKTNNITTDKGIDKNQDDQKEMEKDIEQNDEKEENKDSKIVPNETNPNQSSEQQSIIQHSLKIELVESEDEDDVPDNNPLMDKDIEQIEKDKQQEHNNNELEQVHIVSVPGGLKGGAEGDKNRNGNERDKDKERERERERERDERYRQQISHLSQSSSSQNTSVHHLPIIQNLLTQFGTVIIYACSIKLKEI
ncbi:MAG: hypothetical protein EZS28_003989 [Streblomastix strix]|uniref:Uncharacterized protein n=1 Tax=Streblomastix strix TaxID=222440 RepID=A0A5J4WZR5_9EUKA|nr:MAG: hypothetical protein EZS28_003989 [Streblomastix strix]